MPDNYAIIITACPDEESAKKIAGVLLEKKLAACVQLFPVNSFYWWKGEICNDNEITLLIKCSKKHYAEIEKNIIENHSYELPEIIMLPVKGGYDKYLKWIDEI